MTISGKWEKASDKKTNGKKEKEEENYNHKIMKERNNKERNNKEVVMMRQGKIKTVERDREKRAAVRTRGKMTDYLEGGGGKPKH